MTTVAEVVADANTTRQSLATLEHDLQDGIDSIDFAAFNEQRDLTAREITQRKKLRSTQAEVRDSFRILAFVTAQRLDDTDEVTQLLRQIQVVNAGLDNDLERLQKVAKFAEVAAEVADGLAKVAADLADAVKNGLV